MNIPLTQISLSPKKISLSISNCIPIPASPFNVIKEQLGTKFALCYNVADLTPLAKSKIKIVIHYYNSQLNHYKKMKITKKIINFEYPAFHVFFV